MRKLAEENDVAPSSIMLAAKEFGLKSYVRHLLTQESKDERVEKGKKLNAWLKTNSHVIEIFPDEKDCNVDQAHNSHNDRFRD